MNFNEHFIDVLRTELEFRRQRKIQRRWELAVTIAAAICAAAIFIAMRGI